MRENDAEMDEKDAEKSGLEALVQSAELRAYDFQDILASEDSNAKNMVDEVVDGKKDNSKRAYYKEFRKVVEASDVILEVLDARDPLGCRVNEVEELIASFGPSKRLVLVLNKIDLVPRDVSQKWLKWLRKSHPTIPFHATAPHTSIRALFSLLKHHASQINGVSRVGIIGFPNVGKSSIINALKRSNAVQVHLS